MEDIQFRKIFVSSRDRASGTNSSWMTQLPQTVNMPKNTICYVTDFSVAQHHCSIGAPWLHHRSVQIVMAIGAVSRLVPFAR